MCISITVHVQCILVLLCCHFHFNATLLLPVKLTTFSSLRPHIWYGVVSYMYMYAYNINLGEGLISSPLYIVFSLHNHKSENMLYTWLLFTIIIGNCSVHENVNVALSKKT